MTYRLFFVIVALTLIAPLAQAHGVSTADTVKVINRPSRVVISVDSGQVRVNVKGGYHARDYEYEYCVKPGNDVALVTEQHENRPMCGTDSVKRPHLQVFLSDLYVGWGGNSVEKGNRELIKRSTTHFGILNVIGLGAVFNHNRTRVSAGVGINWTWHRLNKPTFWNIGEEGNVVLEPSSDAIKSHRATLTVYSLQFPLLFSQQISKRWNIAAGPVLNWNFYARYRNGYSLDGKDYSTSARVRNVRGFSLDYVAMVSYNGVGAFFRYSPQSVFKTGQGPEIKNRWTLGIVLRGRLFR